LGFSLIEPSLRAQTAETSSDEVASFEPSLNIVEIKITGLRRTRESWLRSYLGLNLPEKLTRPEIVRLQRRLQTTAIFSDVKVAVEPKSDKLDAFLLWIQVDEKWTTIPVVRGDYGGGTPLTVVGVYDINVLGRLLTAGGEMRKYGDAPPGFVIFGRDPRNSGGRNFFGAEYWREIRVRQFYDEKGVETGILETDATLTRFIASTPFTRDTTSKATFAWRYGLDLEFLNEKRPTFEPDPEYAGKETSPKKLKISESKRQTRLLTTLVYDNVDINQLEMEGLRTKMRLGPNISAGKNYSIAEFDGFYFHMAPLGVNVASHMFLGQSTLNAPSTQYFLGGFDSVRGLPDGIAYGTRFAFANLELRKIALKRKYLWLQPVIFADAGNADNDWNTLTDRVRSSAGLGVRLAVPQVYRLILRIDYAVSTDGSGTRGFTAGMNQFFDPFRPL
jgi:outer membrane protein assembly factor BamA